MVLLDEEKARKIVVIAGFDVMGLLGLFLLAKNMGRVDMLISSKDPCESALRCVPFFSVPPCLCGDIWLGGDTMYFPST